MAGSRRGPDDFFLIIPRSAAVVFHLAVFFVFAPVGLLTVTALEPSRPVLPTVTLLIIAGLVAVCWAATFTISRWFVPGIVVTSLAMFVQISLMRGTPFAIDDPRMSVESLVVIVSIITGYVLFVVFISGRGRTTVRLMTEMSLARDIHDTLVPPLELEDERIEVLGVSSPSTEMGGDLIDAVRHDDRVDLFLADVSGHGVRAGVVMGMVKAAIRMGLRRGGGLAELLARLNDVLETTISSELYATFAGMRIGSDLSVEYALAGHHHIAHVPSGGGAPSRLGERALPLGLFGDQSYATSTLALRPGDLLAVYTDGLNETADERDDELGHDAIERVLVEHDGRSLAEIRDAVLELVTRHGRQDDDRTLLLVRAKAA